MAPPRIGAPTIAGISKPVKIVIIYSEVSNFSKNRIQWHQVQYCITLPTTLPNAIVHYTTKYITKTVLHYQVQYYITQPSAVLHSAILHYTAFFQTKKMQP